MNREREEKPDKLEFPSLTPSSIFSPLSPDGTLLPSFDHARSLYIVHCILASSSFLSRPNYQQSLCISRSLLRGGFLASLGASAFISSSVHATFP